MDENIQNFLGKAFETFGGSQLMGANLTFWWIVFLGFLVGLFLISLLIAFSYYYFYSRKQWNIKVRVHYENPEVKGVMIASEPIRAKRVRFKDGRVVYIYKEPIQGYTITPELLTWTRPREHDIIVTQDKKLFCITGFTSIDEQRKKLNVDISYPDIEMDRQDLQNFIESKKYDDPHEKFKTIMKIASYVFIGIVLIVLSIIITKAMIDKAQIDIERDKINLEVSKNQKEVMEQVNIFISIMKELMPESFKQIDGKTLIKETNTEQNE